MRSRPVGKGLGEARGARHAFWTVRVAARRSRGEVRTAEQATTPIDTMTDEHTLKPQRKPDRGDQTSREHLGAAASAVADDIKAFGHIAAEEGRDGVRRAARAGEEQLGAAREELGEQVESLEQFVRDKPMRSLAYAAASGFLLSLVLRR